MNKIIYSEGSMQTSVNNQPIDNKSYKFGYDGNIGKGFIKDNNDSYYVELDNDDFEKIFKKKSNDKSIKIENQLKTLLSNKSKSKSRSKSRSKSISKRISKSISKSRSKTKKSIKPSPNSKSFRKRTKKKTKSKKTTRKSKGSLKKTNKMPLETNFLKTLL